MECDPVTFAPKGSLWSMDAYDNIVNAYEIPAGSCGLGGGSSNNPPVCTAAHADPATLWPPNHKMVPVGILGVTDPENDPVTITVTGVMQDEPTNGLGDGDTSPDAMINPADGTVQVRAERAGTRDGRVYHIAFMAVDPSGGSCTGKVTVCVPHDQGKGKNCVDEGPLYDSTK